MVIVVMHNAIRLARSSQCGQLQTFGPSVLRTVIVHHESTPLMLYRHSD